MGGEFERERRVQREKVEWRGALVVMPGGEAQAAASVLSA